MSQDALRPLGFGEILDGAFTLYRRNFSTLFVTALLPSIPVLAVWAVFAMRTSGADPEALLDAINGMNGTLMPYSILAAVLVWAALTHQIGRLYTGESTSTGDGFATGFRRLLPLLVAMIVGGVAIFVGLIFFIVPGVLVAIMFFAAAPAAVIERRGPLAALGRSRELAKGAWKRIGGLLLVVTAITTLPNFAIGAAVGAGAIFAGPDPTMFENAGFFLGSQVVGSVVSALVTPFFVGSVVLLYFDRRVRSEAYDLEAAADQLDAEQPTI